MPAYVRIKQENLLAYMREKGRRLACLLEEKGAQPVGLCQEKGGKLAGPPDIFMLNGFHADDFFLLEKYFTEG